MAPHEHDCFVQALQVPSEAVTDCDLLRGPPGPDVLANTDVIFVGGSGDFSVRGSEPFMKQFIDFLADVVVGQGFPTFASCFGFQGLVVAGGGKVIHDAARGEVGTYTIHLTEAGCADPLLGPLAPALEAQLGHVDHVERIPDQMTHLAYSELSPYQAMRVEGVPVFATQFHPELSRNANETRYRRYAENYVESTIDMLDPERDPVLLSLAETPDATALLGRWVDQLLDDGIV